MDSNHRPRAYQARALATWAMSPCSWLRQNFKILLSQFHSPSLIPCDNSNSRFHCLVEMMGFEPMTPCLQGRCSPNWATPPCWLPIVLFCSSLYNEHLNESLHTTDTLEKTSSMRDFQVPADCLTTPALRYAGTTHSKLNNNILTPIWFRVGTRISRSP